MIIESFLVWGVVTASRLPANEDKAELNDALQTAAQAYYIQSGLKDNVDDKLKRYEREYIKPLPIELRQTVVWGLILGRIIQEKRIVYSWELP